MADIHILGGSSSSGDAVRKHCVFHFTIPAQYRVTEAALDPELVAFVSAVPNLAVDDPTEVAAIKDGGIVEKTAIVKMNFNHTPAERIAVVRAQYDAMEARVVQEYRIKYYEYTSTFAR
jgi:hypothetical protein